IRMTTTTSTRTTQVFRDYMKASAEKVWEVITSEEWSARYGYPGHSEYDLRPGAARRAVMPAEMVAHGGLAEVACGGEVGKVPPQPVEVDAGTVGRDTRHRFVRRECGAVARVDHQQVPLTRREPHGVPIDEHEAAVGRAHDVARVRLAVADHGTGAGDVQVGDEPLVLLQAFAEGGGVRAEEPVHRFGVTPARRDRRVRVERSQQRRPVWEQGVGDG